MTLKKILGSVLVVVITLSALSSYAAAQETDDEIVLTIWGDPGGNCINDPENDWSFCAFARMVDTLWHEQHPNIRIEWVDMGWDETLRQNLVAAVEDGTEPDITIGESFMPTLTQQGLFLPLTASEDFKNNLIPATVEGVTWNDEIYGVAVFTGIFTLEVNADVLLANGYDINTVALTTWEQVLTVAQDITESSGGTFYGYSILGPTEFLAAAPFRVVPYLYQAGVELCETQACEVPILNDPNAIPVYEWFRDLYQVTDQAVAFSGNEAAVFSQLFSGLSAMQTAGSWHIDWAESSGCVDCRYFPLPIIDGGEPSNVVVGNAIYAALASTEHPEEAQSFLEFIGSPEVQNAVFWTGGVGRLPTTYSGINSIFSVVDGNTETIPNFYTEVLDYDIADAPQEAGKYIPFLTELVDSNPRTLPAWSSETFRLWNDMFAEILTTDEPVIDILDRYQEQVMNTSQ